MFQIKYLTELIARNEEWILARILKSAQEFNHTIYSSLINHSWRQTISDFTQVMMQSGESCMNQNSGSYSMFDENVFQSFAKDEASRCYERGITPQVYIALLKIVKYILKELVKNSRIPLSEKPDYDTVLDRCIDRFEIAFIGCSTEIQAEERFLEVKHHKRNDIKRFKNVFEYLPVPIMLVDTFHRVTEHNKYAEKAFPFLFTAKKISLNGTIRFDESDTLHSRIDNFFISQEDELTFETPLTYNNKTGYYLITLRKMNMLDQVVVSFIDLTKWQQLEKNLEKSKQKAENSDQLKTAFLANMSHEIRTPMNAIVGFAELLTMTNPSQEERTEYLSLIKKSSNDLLNIIEDVIDVAKIESKQLTIIPKNISVIQLYNDLKALYSELIYKSGKTNLKLVMRIPDKEEKLMLRTDPKRLKQILSNLLGNAVKFTESGQIEFGYKLAENKIVYFYVKDTGIGIPGDMQKRIFDRFVQVDEGFNKNTNGTGLGLSISKSLVQLLGGNIWVSSKEGKGSNFYFYLPYIAVTDYVYDTAKTETEAQDTTVRFDNRSLLIAEDEDTNFFYLKEALKNTGLEIIRAKNGLEAINFAEGEKKIDLILMDIKMPEVNGIEASRYISHIRPEIPIIAQTAFAMDNDKKTCLEAGCVDYISKPIKRDRLIKLIQQHLLKNKALVNG